MTLPPASDLVSRPLRDKSILSRSVAVALGLSVAAASPFVLACEGGPAGDLTIERLPDVSPSLPSVPTIPPPPIAVNHPDGSYSIYGLRRRSAVTMDTDVEVTGYIVSVYEAPPCEEGRTCPAPAAPHMYIADSRDAGEDAARLMVVGYADNQQAIEDARDLRRRGREPEPEEETGLMPVPPDFFPGVRVKVRGRFTRISGSGFNVSEGLLEYRGHETLEMTEEATEALSRGGGRR